MRTCTPVCVWKREIERVEGWRITECYLLPSSTFLKAWNFFQSFSIISLGGQCRQSWKYRKDTTSYLYSLSTFIFYYLLPLMKNFLSTHFFQLFKKTAPVRNQLKWGKKKKISQIFFLAPWTKPSFYFSFCNLRLSSPVLKYVSFPVFNKTFFAFTKSDKIICLQFSCRWVLGIKWQHNAYFW